MADDKKLSILVIDDQEILIVTLMRVLTEMGHDPKGYTEPLDALVAFQQQDFDIVLCDLHMASFSGYKLLYRFYKEKPEKPCYLITGAESNEKIFLQSLRLENVKGALKKPISYQNLEKVVESLDTVGG